MTKYFSDAAVIEELAKPLLFTIEYILHDNTFYVRHEFGSLCNFLHGVMIYSDTSADRIRDACKLLKEVKKVICDIHGFRDLNQYVNDDDDDDALIRKREIAMTMNAVVIVLYLLIIC